MHKTDGKLFSVAAPIPKSRRRGGVGLGLRANARHVDGTEEIKTKNKHGVMKGVMLNEQAIQKHWRGQHKIKQTVVWIGLL